MEPVPNHFLTHRPVPVEKAQKSLCFHEHLPSTTLRLSKSTYHAAVAKQAGVVVNQDEFFDIHEGWLA
jgi:hypothetical protein